MKWFCTIRAMKRSPRLPVLRRGAQPEEGVSVGTGLPWGPAGAISKLLLGCRPCCEGDGSSSLLCLPWCFLVLRRLFLSLPLHTCGSINVGVQHHSLCNQNGHMFIASYLPGLYYLGGIYSNKGHKLNKPHSLHLGAISIRAREGWSGRQYLSPGPAQPEEVNELSFESQNHRII